MMAHWVSVTCKQCGFASGGPGIEDPPNRGTFPGLPFATVGLKSIGSTSFRTSRILATAGVLGHFIVVPGGRVILWVSGPSGSRIVVLPGATGWMSPDLGALLNPPQSR